MRKIFKNFYYMKILFVLVFLFSIITIYSAVSSLVYMHNGSLSYTHFAMQDQSNQVNVIPDYSYAGYMGGGIALPSTNLTLIKQVVSSIDGDDRVNIQSAIDYVESLPLDENGFRGIVLLKNGNYQVSGTLTIKASGVILLGEGQGENGTVITATLNNKHDFLIVQGKGNEIDEDNSSTINITSSYVPVGTNSFDVSDASGFTVGDKISVKKTPNDFWTTDLDMAQYGWVANDYFIKHERIVTNISNNTITINIPIVDVIEDTYGGGVISKANVIGRISNCGIQNIRLKSVYNSPTDEAHAWNAIVLKRTVNSWVKNITAVHFAYSCVQIANQSNFNTIEDCAMLDPISEISGGRRYSFYISNGLGNLFQRCFTRGGRHDYITGARVTGPNVFLDCYAENTYADVGPHHRWAAGTLFDNIYGGQIRVQNRKDFGTGHGWAGVQTMFWNLKSYNEDIKVESPKGAMNWAIGCEGLTKNGDGYWEHWNTRVTPRSLYLQQLEDRLGKQAIENITIPMQRSEEPIWNILSSWAGNGNVTSSVPGDATYPYPKNGSTNVTKTPTLSWDAGIDASSHDVYFGKSNPPQFINNQTDTTFAPGEIEENFIYYWRIDEKNNVGTTKGKVWSFSLLTNLVIDTVDVIADSFVHGGENADNNFGIDDKLIVKSNNLEKYIRETFLKFNLPFIDNQISKANLRLKVSKDVSDVSHKVIFVSDDNWTENEITYNTKPDLGITLDTKLVPSIGEWIEFDVTSQVQATLRNDKIISFAILESSLNHYSSYHSKESSNQNYAPHLVITAIKENNTSSASLFILEQNFPNPFNKGTTIKLVVEISNVYMLTVYNSIGEKVKRLHEGYLSNGEYSFIFEAGNISSGIYYYTLETEKNQITKKMVCLF